MVNSHFFVFRLSLGQWLAWHTHGPTGHDSISIESAIRKDMFVKFTLFASQT